MRKFLLSMVCLFLILQSFASVKPNLFIEEFSSGYSDPLAVRNDGVNNRLYVVQRNGEIYLIDSLGNKSAEPFLDIKSRVFFGGERGLLGLAFHPQFISNRLFVVNYSRLSDGATVIATFKAFEDNPMKADINSEKILLTIIQPAANHNGGDIHFAKDGNLYIGMGDGGGGGDPNNNSQNLQSLLGKMLRIHLDTDSTYSIPSDNPFYNDFNSKGEIWSLGLRNPWRFSFDRLNDDLWIADVGQSAHEEVNHASSPRNGGENYGWRCYEGNESYNGVGCADSSSFTYPIFTYNRTNTTGGQSITGGYVYRGNKFPDLYGYYVCADYLSKNFWLLKENKGKLEVILKNNVLASVTSFGEDIFGEIYLTSFNGKIYKVGSLCSDLKIDSTNIKLLTCPSKNDGSIEIFLPKSSDEYEILWSNGSTLPMITDLEKGWYQIKVVDKKGCELIDSFEVYSSKNIPVITMSGDSLVTNLTGIYQWFENENMIDTAQSFYIIPQQSGFYQVEVTDLDECKLLSKVFELNINSLKGNVSTETFQLYPNPTNDLVMMKFFKDLNFNYGILRIFDLSGKIVFEDLRKNINTPISLSKFSPGFYFIEFSVKEIEYRGIAKVAKMNH
jgi:glucose/arabinose dehydrogenase